MTTTSNSDSVASLPRRDLYLLPLIAVATILVICVSSETIARHAFPDSAETPLDCLVLNDASTGVHALPNTVCRGKLLESPMVEYRFNRCGHRADMECDPAPHAVLRVVLIGSSTTEGYAVHREETFAALLPALLSQRTGRAVKVYNAGMQFGSPLAIDLQFQHTLALKPDILLWTISPWDFSNASLATFVRANRPPDDLASIGASVSATFHKQGFASALGVAIAESIEFVINNRTQFMVRHLLYLSQSQYERNAKMNPEEVEFLRVNPDAASIRQREPFAQYAGEIETKARAAHVPIIVTMLPLRLQASMIALDEGTPEFDPYEPARFARSVVESNGGIFVDILPAFQNVQSTGRFYYTVDGHPNAAGHALLANILANALTSGAVPGLAARTDPAQWPNASSPMALSQP